ncbi:MAG: hypothetical protein OIF32_04065 [Campylobacterales bacterium]|nr:hypothetical protein [Campylobacterales bacterium]
MKEKNIFVYIDQNILVHLLKHKGNKTSFIPKILNECRIEYSRNVITPVYSYETIKEISRSDEKLEYIELLKTIKAEYIENILDKNFNNIVEVQITKKDPTLIFNSLDEKFKNPLDQLNKKLLGGEQDVSLNEINDNIISFIENFLETNPQNSSMFEEQLRVLKTNNFKEEDMIFVKNMGFNSSALGNLEPKTAIQKIFNDPQKYYKGKYNNSLDSITELISKSSLFEKINILYHLLNSIGYKRDKAIDNDNYPNSMSDMTHAGYALYCDYLLTTDKKMSKKANAVYSYLEISTEVVLFDFESINNVNL